MTSSVVTPHNLFRIVDSLLLEHFGRNGDGRIDGIADNGQDGVGAVFGTALDEGFDNASVGVEEIVTRHAGLAGNTGGNDDHLAPLQGFAKAFVRSWRPGSW